MGRPKEDLATRLWSKVDRAHPERCWLWTGCGTRNGYGQLWLDGKMVPAHVVAYELTVGPVPAGMQLDHFKCYQHACVNPAHLRPVTQQKNRENLTGAYRGNRSGIRGVTWAARSGRWVARARVNGVLHHGGSFTDLAEAEKAAIALRNQVMTNNLLDRVATA